jgi:hypothetical protein
MATPARYPLCLKDAAAAQEYEHSHPAQFNPSRFVHLAALSTTQRYLDHLEMGDLLAAVPALPSARRE